MKYYAFKLTKEQAEKIGLDKEPEEMLRARLIRFPDGKPVPCGFEAPPPNGFWSTIGREAYRIYGFHIPLLWLGYGAAQWSHETPLQKQLEDRKAKGEIIEVEIAAKDFPRYAQPLQPIPDVAAPAADPRPAPAPSPAPAAPASVVVAIAPEPAQGLAPGPGPAAAPVRFAPAAPLAPLPTIVSSDNTSAPAASEGQAKAPAKKN